MKTFNINISDMFFEFKDTDSVYKPKQTNLSFPSVNKYDNIQVTQRWFKKRNLF